MIDFAASPVEVAPQLLGAVLRRSAASPIVATTGEATGETMGEGAVAVLITEVEAYPGSGDPASHTYRGETPRCATMFGPPGHLYVYASYGIHRAGNIVCCDAGTGAGVLLRAGRVVAGLEVARTRRTRWRDGTAVVPSDEALARGPGNLGSVLGLSLELDGATIMQVESAGDTAAGDRPVPTLGPDAGFVLTAPASPVEVARGPRIGISKNVDAPLRFWIPGDPTVTSPRGRPRR
ncbi:DNA-3-methyladenine glycosylase [Corynebacterium terpenotabidum]|uniref:Putative 3-methyladenine DNA glycosylase n=1 Tax=Corynebacterium terpenotabidum Y-11 TaxID=1200352 RepID=S4XH90_9CORY|nr:DNA-3-methyladenine glycosylase [Corynebacterium terpenotabidum]AGP31916.1 3-methyladenine DNA glycosylase [Corynebacterium terpenotabidum Y-11]